MKRQYLWTAAAAAVMALGFVACASRPTAFERKFFDIETNLVPRVVLTTNVVWEQGELATAKTEVVQPQVSDAAGRWVTNVVAVTNYDEVYGFKPNPVAEATNAAAAEFLDLHSPATYFGALNPYLRNLPVWVCPTDKLKIPPGTNVLQNRNLSYFLSLSATGVVHNAILAGDRHLADEGKPIPAGTYVVTTNSSPGWTRELHPATRSVGGCLLFADAHTEFVSRTNLARIFREQSQALNRLAIP